jgi:hypothetical protein
LGVQKLEDCTITYSSASGNDNQSFCKNLKSNDLTIEEEDLVKTILLDGINELKSQTPGEKSSITWEKKRS